MGKPELNYITQLHHSNTITETKSELLNLLKKKKKLYVYLLLTPIFLPVSCVDRLKIDNRSPFFFFFFWKRPPWLV